MNEKDESLKNYKENSVWVFVHIDVKWYIIKVCGNIENIFLYTLEEVKWQHISIFMDDRLWRSDILNVEELQQKNLLWFRKNWEEFPLELTIDKIIEPETSLCTKWYIGYIRDLTNEYIDEWTWLINQKQFKKQISENLNFSEENKTYSLIVLSFDNVYKYIDIPEYKNVVFKKYLDFIKQCVESFDITDPKKVLYWSLQWDAFWIALFWDATKKWNIISDKIRKVVNLLNVWTKLDPIYINFWIWVVEWLIANVGNVIDKWLDISLYALHKWWNRVDVFDDKFDKDYQLDKNWIKTIEKALIWNGYHFELYCQPIVSSKWYDEFNYEILLRLFDENNNKQISPALFIPKAERLNLSSRIDNYVIENTFSWLSDNPAHILKLTKCSINLSSSSISDKHKFEYIEKLFGIYKIPPRKICFEVTETWEVKDKKTAVNLIQRLQWIWCEIAIDDFWIWNSSAEKLYAGYYDKVKIDWKFIKWLVDENWKINELYKLLVENVCDISRIMWLKVVAEFVNWKETERVLREIWVDYFQWYESSWQPAPLSNFSDKKRVI